MRTADLVLLRDEALARLSRELPAAVELRHRIHHDPRVGGDEAATAAAVAEALGGGRDLAGGLWLRVGPGTGRAVGLRAELDALPITEDTGLPWSSGRPGVAHLCGHDVHTAALVAVTRAFNGLELPIAAVAAFQPREETIPSGALDFVQDPDFLSNDIRAMVAVHLQPLLAQGSVSAAGGAINAAADNFRIVVEGEPAHGAYPHLSRDPVVAVAGVIQAIQHLVARRIDPMHPSVVTIGKIAGGDSDNQIPASVSLYGTIRTFTQDDRVALHRMLQEVATGVALAHGCVASTVVDRGEPVLHNDEVLAAAVEHALTSDGFAAARPVRSCGADDFSHYASAFPSLMVFAGTGDGHPGSPGLHHPRFAPPDGDVEQVARMLLAAYFGIVGTVLTT
ncbi:M20 metallopeptidase family protein [Nakamurella endophytica]|uniref:N-acyl-L-amino acid amidohydrolase n=1 Tax=Nakamurella endophytica TaxID=1748367 RepID=A0A917WF56_9ACTN|nr:amidohydrolase [Nakamurella endophytica]GGL99103.1 N-acyl-L-amino acid amidohydrolase [Nakamurella endophytica]